jgi:hypothetical protein
MSETATPAPIVRKSKAKRMSELHSESVAIPQKETMVMPPIHEPIERESPIVQVETPLVKSDYDRLAFAEEPVTILIHRSGEKFAPRSTDYIGVNGKGAEMMFKNGWVSIGYLPRGQQVTTKRKYVEVLARSKQDHVNANFNHRENADPENFIEFSTISTCAFSLIHDANPLGVEWLSQLLRQQG